MMRAIGLAVLLAAGCKGDKEGAAKAVVPRPIDAGAKTAPASVPAAAEATAAAKAWVDGVVAGTIDRVVAASTLPFQLELTDVQGDCPEGEMVDAAALAAALECVRGEKAGVAKPLGQKEVAWSPPDPKAEEMPEFVNGWKADHVFVERMPDGTGADPEYVHVVAAVHRVAGAVRVHGVALTHVVEEGD
jgi:hypothetical protein